MGKALAIKGHSTRGKEVIELLEMLGGSNIHNLSGNNSYAYYVNGHQNIIRGIEYIFGDEDMQFFTIEEFLEKYPFKVGDKVKIYVQNDDIDGRYDIEVAEITSMRWNSARCKIAYKMKDINREFYKEEIKCKVDDNSNKQSECEKCGRVFGSVRCFDVDCPYNTPKSYAVSLVADKVIDNLMNDNCFKYINMNTCNDNTAHMEHKKIAYLSINNEDSADQIEINLGDNYEYKFEMNRLYIVKKKSKYPTTYNECCNILGFKNRNKTVQQFLNSCDLYDFELMTKISMLKVCRDAYWKIAGEELGLGKPWKPDWSTEGEIKYVIEVYRNNVRKNSQGYSNTILAFPTVEMRDAFYDNFKDIIEDCKELL